MTRALVPAKGRSDERKPPRPPSRAPQELREVLASPGHPLDPGVRRDLETKLGHDFSRVRVHHDRDSAAMTDLLGADAVTVGQDIFFARDTFRPETTDGRRLLVHELLHTVQAPEAGGAVRAGRDSGAVSQPQEPVEQEAERIARSDRPERPVEQARAGASWLRYATVDADRMRTERLDPATLVDRLVAGVLRSLRGDPEDVSGRVRGQLSRFTPELRETVLIRLKTRLPSPEYARVLEILAETEGDEASGPVETPGVPEPVGEEEPPVEEEEPPAPSEEVPDEQAPGEDPVPEPEEEPAEEAPEEEPEPEEQEADEEKESDKEEGEKEEEKAEGEAEGETAPEPLAQAPGAPGAQPADGAAPVAGATPAVGGTAVAEPATAGPEQVERVERAPESPLVRHGLLEREDREDTDHEQEQPIGVEPGADAEVDVPEPEEDRAPEEEPERPPLRPEDFLPSTDPDVSNVPTADQLVLPSSGAPPTPPPAPTFPAPPPTKAEQTEDQDEPEPAEAEPAPPVEPAAVAAPVEEESPADERPLDAEVGPEQPAPETEPVGGQPFDARTGAAEVEPPAMGGPAAVEPVDTGPVGTGPDLGADQVETGPAPAPEASLEPGGGACGGPPVPTAGEASGGAGCAAGGGAGGPAAPAEPQAAPPDVSAQPPEAALASVSTLPPDAMQASLSGVDASVTRDVGDQQSALAAAPPTADRPAGAPRTLSGPPQAAPPGEFQGIALEKTAAERAEEQKRVQAERIEGQNQANSTPQPHVAGDAQGNLSPDEIENVQQAVENVPTSDPALNTTVGPAPKVELSGETDPARTDQQTGELRQVTTTAHQTGVAESAKPLGEDQVFPDVPAETLTAQVPGGTSAGPPPALAGPTEVDAGVAVVAQQERGPQIQTGVERGRTQMGTERQTQQQGADQANADHRSEVAATVEENAAAQTAERGKVATDVAAQREDWRAQQDQKVEESDTEAGKEHDKARTGISDEKTETDRETEKHQKEENDKITRERETAEEKARKEKEEKQRESEDGGFFSWIASKVTSFFNALLDAITDIFNAAVALVNNIIKGFASLVTGLIDLARKAIVGLIEALATVLLALCDVLAVFFPELAAKMRKAIEDVRDAAIAAVNELADQLKAGVEFLLNKLAEALTGLLRLLEAGLKAAVEVVRAAVNAAIEFAKAAIQLLGEFAAIIADIASMGVGAWLGRLASSAKEGIQKYLWDAIKTAVKQWFNEKVEAVLGLGKAVIDILVKGCVSVAQIGKMVWDSIVAALPMIIVAVVVERLVSLIIPAAGAVLAIVQGLMAAWGTVSRILGAIGAFIAFAKAVKAGPAACLFAVAVAAGVVALLEFITNFLLAKLAMAAKGVGRALKGMAAKIKKGLARAGRGARRGAGNAVNAARRGVRGAGKVLRPPRGQAPRRRPGGPVAGTRGRPTPPSRRTPAQRAADRRRPEAPRRPPPLSRARNAVRNGVKRVATTLRNVGRRIANSKLGRALRNTAKRLRDKYQRARDRWRAKQKQRAENRRRRDEERNSPQSKQRRLDLIVAKIRPKLQRTLDRGVPRPVLRGILASLRMWYRLSGLALLGRERAKVLARLNPEVFVIAGVELGDNDIRKLLGYIKQLAEAIIETGDLKKSAKIERSQYNARNGQKVTPETEEAVPHEARRDLIEVHPGARGQELQAELRRDPRAKPGVMNLIRFINRGKQQDVKRTAGGRYRRNKKTGEVIPVGNYPENQLVHMEDIEGKTRALSYPDLQERIGMLSPEEQQALSIQALARLRGKTPAGEQSETANQLSTWIVQQESRRNPSAFVTSALALDTVASGRKNPPNLLETIQRLPMRDVSAQAQARTLNKFLDDPKKRLFPRARALATQQVAVIDAWARSLDMLTTNDTKKEELLQKMYTEIRNRMFTVYALTKSEISYVLGKVGHPK